jgi:hypothetical protein
MEMWITVVEFAVVEFERLYKTKGQNDAIKPSHNKNVICFDCYDGSCNALVDS